jgi:hypothetical protein
MAGITAIAAGVGLATSLAGSGAEMQKNYLDQLAIAKEPYEFQREMMAQQTAQALAGLQEGDPRGLAAGVGRVAGVGTQAAQQMRAGMSQEIQQLEQMKAQEDARLARSRADLALEEAKGAGAAAAQAANLRAQGIQQGVQGVVDAGTSAMQFAALYGKSGDPKPPSGVDRKAAEKRMRESMGRPKIDVDLAADQARAGSLSMIQQANESIEASDSYKQAIQRMEGIDALGVLGGVAGFQFNPFNYLPPR